MGLLSKSMGPARLATARPLRSYRFPLLLPLPDVARSLRLPPDSLFSFDRRWSIFLRPLSCFCFATRTPTPEDRTLAPVLGPIGSSLARTRVAAGVALSSPVCAGRDSYHLARGPVSVNRRPFPTDANRPNIMSEAPRISTFL